MGAPPGISRARGRRIAASRRRHQRSPSTSSRSGPRRRRSGTPWGRLSSGGLPARGKKLLPGGPLLLDRLQLNRFAHSPDLPRPFTPPPNPLYLVQGGPGHRQWKRSLAKAWQIVMSLGRMRPWGSLGRHADPSTSPNSCVGREEPAFCKDGGQQGGSGEQSERLCWH